MRNIFQAGAQGWQDTDDMASGIVRKRAGYRAAPKIAAGDYAGAAQEYGEHGLDREAGAMQGQVQRAEQEQYDRGREADADKRAQAVRALETFGKLANGLRQVPPGQRKAALQRAYPIIQQMQIDPAQFEQITEDQLSDEQLALFAGEMEKQLQIVNRGGGGYDVVDTMSGDVVRSVAPDPKLQVIGNGAVAIDARTREPVYRNPKTFAPKSGGGGGKSLPPPPAGWTPAR